MSAGSGCNAFTRDEEYAVKFLNEFQDQLLFGIDICSAPEMEAHGRLARFLLKLRDEGKISATVFEKVARGNAKKVLKLD